MSSNDVYVSPVEIWSNFYDLSEKMQIKLTEIQYRKQLKSSHTYKPMEEML